MPKSLENLESPESSANLKSKVAIVTGASRGLGKQIALQLARDGVNVVLVSRSRETLTQVSEVIESQYPNVKTLTLVSDICTSEDRHTIVKTTLEHFGRLDILVNNAGIGHYKAFLDHSEHEIQQILSTNLNAAITLCYEALPAMKEKKSGHIVNIASDLSQRPLGKMAVYAASKFGLRGFSLSLLQEVQEFGVRVSLVHPGIIDTSFNDGVEDSQSRDRAMSAERVAETIVQVLKTPPEVVIDELTIHPRIQA